ncbi:MAG: hypothetical protein OXE99_10205 [Cellvibrionales bacterium]|nr:hypothetical protein [Cellvibrionales bacterium]
MQLNNYFDIDNRRSGEAHFLEKKPENKDFLLISNTFYIGLEDPTYLTGTPIGLNYIDGQLVSYHDKAGNFPANPMIVKNHSEGAYADQLIFYFDTDKTLKVMTKIFDPNQQWLKDVEVKDAISGLVLYDNNFNLDAGFIAFKAGISPFLPRQRLFVTLTENNPSTIYLTAIDFSYPNGGELILGGLELAKTAPTTYCHDDTDIHQVICLDGGGSMSFFYHSVTDGVSINTAIPAKDPNDLFRKPTENFRTIPGVMTFTESH